MTFRAAIRDIIPLLIESNKCYSTLASTLIVYAVRLAVSGLDEIPTSFYTQEFLFKEKVQARIPGATDVIVINNNPRFITDPSQYQGQEKIYMPEFSTRTTECSLAEQSLFNDKCKIKDISLENMMHDLNIDEVVSMKDLKDLEYGVIDIGYTDICDLGPVDPEICKPQIFKKKGKMVNFLEKFADPKEVTEAESWYLEKSTMSVNQEQIKTE